MVTDEGKLNGDSISFTSVDIASTAVIATCTPDVSTPIQKRSGRKKGAPTGAKFAAREERLEVRTISAAIKIECAGLRGSIRDDSRVPSEISWRRLGLIEAAWLISRLGEKRSKRAIDSILGKFHLDKAMEYFRTELREILQIEPPTEHQLRYLPKIFDRAQCLALNIGLKLDEAGSKYLQSAAVIELADLNIAIFEC